MTDTLTPPAYCSLDREAYTVRLAQIIGLMLKFEGKVENTSSGAVLRFRRGEGLKAALEDLIEAEGRCCSSLAFSLKESGAEYALHVVLPEGASPDARTSGCC